MSGLFKKYQIMCTNPSTSLEIFEVGHWAEEAEEAEEAEGQGAGSRGERDNFLFSPAPCSPA